MDGLKIVLDFIEKPAILFEVMREKKRFLNVTFKVQRHPDYTGNHELASFDHIMGNTFPLGTTKQEMTDEFLAEVVVRDIEGKTWTKGEMIEVIEITKCFEDSAE